MKIEIIGGKVCLRCEGKTLLGVVSKVLKTKSLLTRPSNVLPLHLKQTFPPINWIFTEGEGDGIESRLPFKIFSTLSKKCPFFVLKISSDWKAKYQRRIEIVFTIVLRLALKYALDALKMSLLKKEPVHWNYIVVVTPHNTAVGHLRFLKTLHFQKCSG